MTDSTKFTSLAAVAATGAGLALAGGFANTLFTMQTIFTGAPTAVKVVLEGSLDGGTTYDPFLTFDTALGHTSGRAFSVAGYAFDNVRARLVTLTGGTSPTVTAIVSAALDGAASGGAVLCADGVNPASATNPLPVTPVVAGTAASATNPFPVVTPLTRSVEFSGTFTPGSTSYTVNQAIGATGANAALQSIDLAGAGIAAGTRARINRVQLNLVFGSAPAAIAAAFGNFFLAAPSVAITDGVTPLLVAADAANVRTTISMTANSFNATLIVLGGAAGYGLTVPVSGLLKFYFSSSGVQTWTTPGVFTWLVEVVY